MTDAAATHLRAEKTEKQHPAEQKLSIAHVLRDTWGPQASRTYDFVPSLESAKHLDLPILDLVIAQHGKTDNEAGNRAISNRDQDYVRAGLLPPAGSLLGDLVAAQDASSKQRSAGESPVLYSMPMPMPVPFIHPTVVGEGHHEKPSCGTGKIENEKWKHEEKARKRREEAESKFHKKHEPQSCGTGQIELERQKREEEARKRREEAETKFHKKHEPQSCGTGQIELERQRKEKEQQEQHHKPEVPGVHYTKPAGGDKGGHSTPEKRDGTKDGEDNQSESKKSRRQYRTRVQKEAIDGEIPPEVSEKTENKLHSNPNQFVRDRVAELKKELGQDASNRMTMGVAVVEDTKTGKRYIIVASSEPRYRTETKGEEKYVVNPGSRHAELKITDWLKKHKDYKLVSIGATRDVCGPCQDGLKEHEEKGATVATPKKPIKPDQETNHRKPKGDR